MVVSLYIDFYIIHDTFWSIFVLASADDCYTQASVAFDGLPKTCPIASPPLVVLVAHRVVAFWVGNANCQTLAVAPFETCVPASRQLIAYTQLPTVSPLRL